MDSTKDRILSGVNLLADTVKVTLGTRGRLVMYTKYRDFEDPEGEPVLTKDGVTVAEQVKSNDPVEQLAIKVVRRAAQNTVETSGDGTTSTLTIAQYIINKGYELRESGVSSWEMKREIDHAVEDITAYIRDNSIEVGDDIEKIRKVASVSSNSPEIGKFIADIIDQIGIYSDIEIKSSTNYYTEVEMTKGMKLHKGYFSPFFCDDLELREWRAGNVKVLIYDEIIRDYSDIAKYIRVCADEEGNPLPILIYAQDVSKQALNRIQGLLKYNPRPLMIVEHDGFGDRRIEIMNDLSIITGAQIVDNETKIINHAMALGSCEEAIVNDRYTSILGGMSSEDEVEEQIQKINKILEKGNPSKNEIKFYKKRLANLYGGVAVIHVGGKTPEEMKEEKMRIEDAVLAVKCAINMGINYGGAYTWERASKYAINNNRNYTRQDNPSYFLVFDSVRIILDQLLINSGEFSNDKRKTISDSMIDESNPMGYDLIDRKLHPISSYEIYDATSVLLDSIRNASSVAKSILSVERAIHDGTVYK